jgi:5-hydroxyisourate hydrolase-like protein (transthyretin family)
LTAHVLDATTWQPAEGVAVRLDEQVDASGAPRNTDARTPTGGPPRSGIQEPGFTASTSTPGGYFAAAGVATFYPEVTRDD